MNERLHPTLVTAEHSYTRSDEPWRLDEYTAAHGETSSGKEYGWKLFHYISGGGMRTFGRTIRQEIRSRRQNRFLVAVAVGFVIWFCFLVF